jgi:putative SOS response-associated peptidase YedK
MCGRARLSSDVSEIKLVFSIPPDRPTPNIAASWNVAPTDPLPVVRHDAKKDERRARPANPPKLKALLAPYPAEEMTCWEHPSRQR